MCGKLARPHMHNKILILQEGVHELTADKLWMVASRQQLSRRTMGLALPSLKAQYIRVSLSLISTPSTLSCRKKLN